MSLARTLLDRRPRERHRLTDRLRCPDLCVDSNALYFSRALIPHSKSGAFSPQTTTYLRHVGLYAFRTEFLLQFPTLARSPLEDSEDLEQLRVLSSGHKIKLVQVDSTLPGVDTQADLDALKARWSPTP